MAKIKQSKVAAEKPKYSNSEKQAFVKFLTNICNFVPHAAVRMLKPDLSIREAMIEAEQLLADPLVKKEIEKLESELTVDSKRVEKQAVTELLNIALVDATDFYYQDEKNNLVLRPLKELTRTQTAAIKKIDIKYDRKGNQTIMIDLIDKLSAMKLLGSYFKFLNSDEGGSDNIDHIEMAKMLAQHLEEVEVRMTDTRGDVKDVEVKKIKVNNG